MTKFHFTANTAVFTLLLTVTAFAQPRVNWAHSYDGGAQGFFRDIFALDNGDFCVSGHAGQNIWVARLDSQGEVIWSNRYGGGSCDGWNAIETDGGDIVVAAKYDRNYAVMKLHSDGREAWTRTFAAGNCFSVIELKNGNIASIGYWSFNGPNGGTRLPRLVILNSDGETLLNRVYNDFGEGSAFTALRERDDGLVISGLGNNLWLLCRIRLDGRIEWQRNHWRPSYIVTWWNDLVSTEDGGFALLGQIQSEGFNGQRFILTVTSGDGNAISQRVYADGGNNQGCGSLAMVRDVGFLMGAGIAGENHPAVVCVDQEGEPLWTSIYDSQIDENFSAGNMSASIQTGDRSIVAAGGAYSNADPFGRAYGYVMRLEPLHWVPAILYYSPEDTERTVLPGDSIHFIVRARDQFGQDLDYQWWKADSMIANDTSVVVHFDSLGIDTIQARVLADQWTVCLNWHVTVADLFIRTHTPDTLSLTIHHGETVPFGLSVTATPGDDPNYLWTLTDWAGGRFDTLGTDSMVSHLFDHGGAYLLEGMASRGASADTVAWNIRVISNVVAYHPDRTRLMLPQDTTVVFSVEPSEFDTGQYRYEWMVDGGWCSDSASAQVGFPFLGRSYVTVVVADSSEADTIVWEVEVVEPNATPPTPPSIEGEDYPHQFTLLVSPNPFNHRTAIRYSVPSRGEVRVSAYDVSGRLVKELYRGDRYPGEYSILWQAPAAGVYLIQVETDGGIKRVEKGVCLP